MAPELPQGFTEVAKDSLVSASKQDRWTSQDTSVPATEEKNPSTFALDKWINLEE